MLPQAVSANLIINCGQWDIALGRIDAILRSGLPATASRWTSAHRTTDVIATRAPVPSSWLTTCSGTTGWRTNLSAGARPGHLGEFGHRL
jgi:hypothetical protein